MKTKLLLEIHVILRAYGWTKLPTDSLWHHPDHGNWHILFAYYKATRDAVAMYKSSTFSVCEFIISLAIGYIVGFIVGYLIGVI